MFTDSLSFVQHIKISEEFQFHVSRKKNQTRKLLLPYTRTHTTKRKLFLLYHDSTNSQYFTCSFTCAKIISLKLYFVRSRARTRKRVSFVGWGRLTQIKRMATGWKRMLKRVCVRKSSYSFFYVFGKRIFTTVARRVQKKELVPFDTKQSPNHHH